MFRGFQDYEPDKTIEKICVVRLRVIEESIERNEHKNKNQK